MSKQLNMLTKQNQKLEDEIKLLLEKIKKVKKDRESLETNINELELENDMASNEVDAVKRSKEKVLV